jgi:Cu(I)/Ag(I) efflux system membrane protein CusA/SilA
MIERIIEFSAHNRFIVLLFILGLSLWGWWAFDNTRMDALPDISDTQVIVYSTWMGRSPDLMEDQVTYPIVTALLSTPNVTAVRGFPILGFLMSISFLKRELIFIGREVGCWNILINLQENYQKVSHHN